MKMISKAAMFGMIAVEMALVSSSAEAAAALSLVLQPVGGTNVQAGATVPIQVYLEGTRATAIAGLQFNVTTPPSGATLVASATASDGFDESPLATTLDLAIDGELLTKNLTLAFAQNNGTGILAGSNDVLIGTFWVQTPSAIQSSYAVTLNTATATLPDFSTSNLGITGTTLLATVPEPATLGLLGLGAFVLGRRRPKAISPTGI